MSGEARSAAAVVRHGFPRWRPGRAQLAAAGLWVLAAVTIGHLIATAVGRQMLDLDVYRTGALVMRHGGKDLYSIHAADRLPFTYPPVSAILAVPLTLVSFQAAKTAWMILTVGVLAVAVGIGFWPLLSRAKDYAPALFAVLLTACAFLEPVRQVITYGQVDLLLLVACVVDCCAKRTWWPRGLLIGLATAIKLEPGAFIIYLLITKRRKEALVAGLSFVAATGLAYLISPSVSRTYWTSAIFNTARLGGNASAANQSLRGLILRMHLGSASVPVWVVVALVVGTAGFLAARECWKRGHEVAGVTITGLLSALLSPVAWIHHLCWVVLAIGVIVGAGRSYRRIAVAVAAFGLFLTTLPTWAERQLALHQLGGLAAFLAENSFCIACVALVGVLWAFRPAVGELAIPQPELSVQPGAAGAAAASSPTSSAATL
jgi:alpha-1,2-mannosyltransferase